jgi:hypothetical protein
MRRGSPRLSVAQQAFAIHSLLPDAKVKFKPKGGMEVVVVIQPTPMSRRYMVRIDYRAPSAPDVYVIAPELQLHAEADVLPHTYPGDKLCLHLPGEWRSEMCIAHTTVPWTSEWLFYYELWLVTGQWNGGGHEPHPAPKHMEAGCEDSTTPRK